MTYEAPVTDPNARTWGTMAHVAGFATYLLPPLGGVVATLVIWLVKRDEHSFIEDQAREALNFNITVALAISVAGMFSLVLIGIPFLVLICVFHIVGTIMAVISANQGIVYRYPLAIRLVSPPVN